MNAPVDVLAVLDEAARSQPLRGDREDMREARAAVAELIEREVALRRTIEAIKANAVNSPQCDADRLQDIVALADAALARVGGAR